MSSSLADDLWAIILLRLPLKHVTSSKLVCKQWKLMVESCFFRKLFMSHHQNSDTCWSLTWKMNPQRYTAKEVVAHYGCGVWGLERSIGSYISSFITAKFNTKYDKVQQKVEVLAYSDAGLILIGLKSMSNDKTYYVANPISQQCVEIPPPSQLPEVELFEPSGLVVRILNGVVSDYKVVMLSETRTEQGLLDLLIYSSETCLWSIISLHSSIPLLRVISIYPVNLNGKLYWLGFTLDGTKVVVAHDFFDTGKESNQCKVIHFPDVGPVMKYYRRFFTTSQGYVMYMNIYHKVNGHERKLRIWRLEEGMVWRQLSENSASSISSISDPYEYYPMAINPLDGSTMYLWSEVDHCSASMNLYKGEIGFHNRLEYSGNGGIMRFAIKCDQITTQWLPELQFSVFVLPSWLYRIPPSPSS